MYENEYIVLQLTSASRSGNGGVAVALASAVARGSPCLTTASPDCGRAVRCACSPLGADCYGRAAGGSPASHDDETDCAQMPHPCNGRHDTTKLQRLQAPLRRGHERQRAHKLRDYMSSGLRVTPAVITLT